MASRLQQPDKLPYPGLVTGVTGRKCRLAEPLLMDLDSLAPLRSAVERALDRVRPGLLADGGNVELMDVSGDGVVRIRFQGECVRCPARLATLRVGIEEPLQRRVPGVTAVVPID